MSSVAGMKRNGLPFGLIQLHERVMQDMIVYFEKGKVVRKKTKEARKAVKQALKVARKKKINPGVKINRAREALDELLEEVEYTRKVIRATADEMDEAIKRIEEERVREVMTLMDRARDRFRNKDIEKAMDLLKESQAKMANKILERTRTALLGGVHSEVKKLKYQLQERKNGKASKE
jgi:hypothetical protein